ncbi:phospholipase A2 SSD387-like [Homarus americanus]|uniref:phospholipase A2 SSD387-like n=1 Tax=Homarus americanus TaxID=6706 RepID=UPI001C43F7C8|nr:phospholipase A2 SSD387-like [Homarus americanus]
MVKHEVTMEPTRACCLLLLLAICLPSLSEGATVRGLHRQRRSIGQFGDMIRFSTRREALLYNNYGNHCGFQGGDLPVLDEVDSCCRSHDLCYDTVNTGPCATSWLGASFIRYSWSWNGTGLRCGEYSALFPLHYKESFLPPLQGVFPHRTLRY